MASCTTFNVVSDAGAQPDILGGSWSPIGWSVGWIEMPLDETRRRLVEWRRSLAQGELEIQADLAPWPLCLESLSPLESPWTTELIVSHGDSWTCYLNNGISGGDPAGPLGYLSHKLDRLVVLSTHHPPKPGAHASTQFEVIGPGGQPPLNYIRTLSAHATDGRRQWDESGDALPFEDPAQYRPRRIRDRFPRSLLIAYLGAMGIEPDNRQQFGRAVLIKQHVPWPRRQQTLPDARRYWDLN